MVPTWPLASWSLFIGLFYTLKSPFLAWKMDFFINFVRILWFIWDLGLVLFDSHKDVVSGKILIFGNILGFLEVKWAQKWFKTVTFGYAPFTLEHWILKNYSKTVFGLWEAFLGSKLQQIWVIFGEKGPRNSPKGAISWMLYHHENIWKFITWQPQMLHKSNLPRLRTTSMVCSS